MSRDLKILFAFLITASLLILAGAMAGHPLGARYALEATARNDVVVVEEHGKKYLRFRYKFLKIIPMELTADLKEKKNDGR